MFSLGLDFHGIACNMTCDVLNQTCVKAKGAGLSPGSIPIVKVVFPQTPCEWCGSCHGCSCQKAFEDNHAGVDIEQASTICESNDSKPSSTDESLGDPSMQVTQAEFPDFNGSWRLIGVEGDIEEVMVDAKVSWVVRKMARSCSYGAGILRQNITQEQDHFVIEHCGAPGSGLTDFRIGAGEQRIFQEDATVAIVNPMWHGQALHVDGTLEDGTPMQALRRYLNCENQMVIEVTTSTGWVAKRLFRKE